MPSPRPNAAFDGLNAYKTPRHRAPVDLLLNSNEGPPPPASLMEEALRDMTGTLNRYPSTAVLEAELAARIGVDASQVLVTAGADEAIDRAFRVFLAPGRRLVLPSPTFVMLAHYARLAGCDVTEVPWPGTDFPEDAVLAACTADVAAIACVTPNNPTGAIISPETIRRLARANPTAMVFVDLAYAEFATRDPMTELLDIPNALFFRTFSKAWGLAAARVGYAVGTAQVIAWLRAAASPYSVPQPSVALALALLRLGPSFLAERVAAIASERAAILLTLAGLGVKAIPSEANFVFATLATSAHAAWLVDALAGLGISIRGFASHPTLSRSVRITCPGDADALSRLTRGLQAAIEPRRRIVEDPAALETSTAGPTWFLSRDPGRLARARALGAVPIGLDADGARSPNADALYAAGAARIVTDLNSFEESLL